MIMNTSIQRIITAVMECEAALPTCADEHRVKVICRLARELCNGIASLTEAETDESGKEIAACSEALTEEIAVSFMDAEDKREDRRTAASRAAARADYARTA
jgi:hypothetical protein